MWITQVVSNSTPNIGDTITLTVTVNNNVNIAKNVLVKINIPAGLTVETPPPSFNNSTGIWVIDTVTSGFPEILSLTIRVDDSGMKTIWSEIWSTYNFDIDSVPGNSIVTEDDYSFVKITTPSATNADLSITKIVNTDMPNVNDNVVFTITVLNSGNDTATNVEVKDKLPVGLTYISDTTGGTDYNSSTGIWKIASISANNSVELKITANVSDVGVKTNYAEIYSMDQSDPDTADHVSSSVTIMPSGGVADLTLTQSPRQNPPASPVS